MTHASLLRRAGALAAVAALALAPAAQAKHQGHKGSSATPGVYDCWSQFGTFMSYVISYEIDRDGRYGVGSRLHGNKLQGKIDWGRYRAAGKRLVPSSGPLKKQHYYLLVKNRSELILVRDNGKSTGVGCYLHKP